jgi:hypothetical protein
MNEVLAFVNENWEKILKIFNVKILKDKNELLKYQEAILFLSEDKRKEIEPILQKLEEREIIIGEVPESKESKFEIEDVQRLISKVLGFSLKK